MAKASISLAELPGKGAGDDVVRDLFAHIVWCVTDSRSSGAVAPNTTSEPTIGVTAATATVIALGDASCFDRSQDPRAAKGRLIPRVSRASSNGEKALVSVVQEAYIHGVFDALGRRADRGTRSFQEFDILIPVGNVRVVHADRGQESGVVSRIHEIGPKKFVSVATGASQSVVAVN